MTGAARDGFGVLRCARGGSRGARVGRSGEMDGDGGGAIIGEGIVVFFRRIVGGGIENRTVVSKRVLGAKRPFRM